MTSWAPTQLQLWLRRNSYYVRDAANVSHLLLNGGKVAVPRDRVDEMYGLMAADDASGGRNFVVEMRRPEGEPSRCVIDFDAEADPVEGTFGGDAEVPDSEWNVLYAMLRDVVHEAFPGVDASITVLKAASKTKPNGRVKTGRHVVLPHLYLTSDVAKRVREAVIFKVVAMGRDAWASLCPRLAGTDIDDVYDLSVMDANGIRMPLQHKAHACGACAKRRRHEATAAVCEWSAARSAGLATSSEPPKIPYRRYNECDKCQGASYIYEGRPYSAYECYDDTGSVDSAELERLLGDAVYLMRATSVYGDDEPSELAKNRHPVSGVLPERTAVDVARDARKKSHMGAAGAAKAAATTYRSLELVPNTHPGWKGLEEFLRDAFVFRREDGSIDVPALHGLTRLRVTSDRAVMFADSTSNACLNRAKEHPFDPEHSHSRIYFMITPLGLVTQRCHCLRTYAGVPCHQYASDARVLPSDLVEKLWGTSRDLGPQDGVSMTDVRRRGGCKDWAEFEMLVTRRVAHLERLIVEVEAFAQTPRTVAASRKTAAERAAQRAKKKKRGQEGDEEEAM